tara:strand:- start:188 stop:667 length:480 start_codon:yes stop_codon:yes gene_type:complete
MKYRSEIDGLRALAVVPVILFHAGFQFFKGGFVGVDVFFVISGYLITSIIIYEINQKKFNILNFYDRRIRRINLEERNNLRNEIPQNILMLESKLKFIVPSDNFVSYIENLSLEGKILITDDNGNLISDDRQHFTLSGAKYVGENVFKRNSLLSSYFED